MLQNVAQLEHVNNTIYLSTKIVQDSGDMYSVCYVSSKSYLIFTFMWRYGQYYQTGMKNNTGRSQANIYLGTCVRE